MLNRYLIRERVNLLVALPLMVVLFMTVPFIADRLQSVRTAHQNADATNSARAVGRLVEALGRERALSIAYLLTPNSRATSLVDQVQTVGDGIYEVRRYYGGQPPAKLDQALSALSPLNHVRADVQANQANLEHVETAYNTAIDALINSLATVQAQSGAAGSRDFLALSALLTGNEQADRAATDAMGVLLDLRLTPAARERELTGQTVAQQIADQQIALFRSLAVANQAALFDQVAGGGAAMDVAQVESRSLLPPTVPAADTDRARLASQLYSAVETDAQLRELVEEKIARDTAVQSTATATQAQAAGIAFAGLALSLFAATLLLSIAIGRSITRPLRRLTVAAGQVADVAGAELARVADDESGTAAPPRLAAIDLDSQDEIGELAGVVNRVQAAAILLLERQLASRANMSAMFRSVGRRTQSLVDRQTAVIDVLERDERDDEVLERLYGLDHLTARLRRHADSLLVLSGWTESALATTPVSLAVLIRSAFGGVEEFQRIQLATVSDVWVAAEVASDLILLLAELLDNATRFSPPHTVVRVDALVTDSGLQIAVTDHGLGMPPDRMAQENQRIVRRERLDLVATDVLGLFVVGRLCRRHGLRASLRPAPEGGVRAVVEIPVARLVSPGQASPIAGGRPEPRAVEPEARASGLMASGRRRSSPAPATGQLALPGAQLPQQAGAYMLDDLQAGLELAGRAGPSGSAPSATQESAATVATEPAGSARAEDVGIGETMARVRASLDHLAVVQERPAHGGFVWFEIGGRQHPMSVPPRGAVTSPYPPAQAPPSAVGLVRRVPGTHLVRDASPTPSTPAAERTIDAAALRASLDEFEAAVNRGRAAPGTWPAW
ncbi:nitrate- and nitrite sensing domain-containing protein [Streptomyces mirabilis]